MTPWSPDPYWEAFDPLPVLPPDDGPCAACDQDDLAVSAAGLCLPCAVLAALREPPPRRWRDRLLVLDIVFAAMLAGLVAAFVMLR